MQRLLLVVFTLALAFSARPMEAGSAETSSISGHGWKITADERTETIVVAHDSLGMVIQAARFAIIDKGIERPLHGWKVRRETSDEITILTAEPEAFWRIRLNENYLIISCTNNEALLTATVASSKGRQLVRLLDSEGVPVTWAGNDEVHNNYGGSDTEKLSFLPRNNADVMTFALGSVTATNLHSLFDQATDTAIDFPEQTMFTHGHQAPDQLETTIHINATPQSGFFLTTMQRLSACPIMRPLTTHTFQGRRLCGLAGPAITLM